MEFKEIATVSGKGGLFKILNPTRTGVILESMDENKAKLVVNANSKVSVLHEISIYTTDAEGTVPLEEVLRKVHKEFQGDTGLSKNSDGDELKAFLKHILPAYDTERVYVSDIKKLVNWYGILLKEAPEVLEEQPEPKPEKEDKGEAVKKKKAPKAAEEEAAEAEAPAQKPAAKKKNSGKK